MKQEIQLSDHFGYKRLVRFTMPSIFMMIVVSIYGVIDGFFISNFVGKTPFSAVNFIMPFLMVVGALGFMFGAGGSALIAKTMGEGDDKKANEIFSLITYITIISGIIISVISVIFLRSIASFLGAEGSMLEDAVTYGRIILIALPLLMVQYAYGSFVIAAEKPKLGLCVSIMAGITNFIGDALFIVVLKWGVVGAALATAVGQAVGGIIPLVYFSRNNPSRLRLVKCKWDGKAFLKTCTNGSSELISNISMSVVGMLYNIQLLKYAGENGIAAYGTIMYVNFIFISVFLGYSVGVSPLISYHFGACNHDELKGLLKKSFVMIISAAVLMFIIAKYMAMPLSKIYVGYDKELLEMTTRAFVIYAYSFLFAGFASFGSAFFTALNNGAISATISFLRTLVFEIASVLLLPLIWGLDGIWVSIIVAEFMAVVVTVIFLITNRKKYKYL